jgi:hypothetical protein
MDLEEVAVDVPLSTSAAARGSSAPLHVSSSRSHSLPVVESARAVSADDLAVIQPERTVHVVGETTDGVLQVQVPIAEANALAEGKTLLAVGGGTHPKDYKGTGRAALVCVRRKLTWWVRRSGGHGRGDGQDE